MSPLTLEGLETAPGMPTHGTPGGPGSSMSPLTPGGPGQLPACPLFTPLWPGQSPATGLSAERWPGLGQVGPGEDGEELTAQLITLMEGQLPRPVTGLDRWTCISSGRDPGRAPGPTNTGSGATRLGGGGGRAAQTSAAARPDCAPCVVMSQTARSTCC